MSFKKLYLITGKGGVGKTMTALSLTSALKKRSGKKVVYNSFDMTANKDLCAELDLDYINLPIDESVSEYVGRKLGSRKIASWVTRAPFFKALFNMVPSLGYMITLGHIIDILNQEDVIFVVDAPSSGHILTILESPKIFNKIFKTGAIVNDIKKMTGFLTNKDLVETWVINNPTKLSVTEGSELADSLHCSGLKNIKFVLNNALSKNTEISEPNLPQFIKKKLEIEENVIEDKDKNFDLILPMFIDKTPAKLVKRIEENISTELYNEE